MQRKRREDITDAKKRLEGSILMVIILVIVGILIFIGVFLCFLYDDSELQKHRDLEIMGEAQRIKFKTFAAMYEMNPSHWRCEKYVCQYRPTATEYFYFSFGIIDYFRWKSFLFDLEAKKLQKADLSITKKDYQERITAVMTDLDADLSNIETVLKSNFSDVLSMAEDAEEA